MKCPICGNETFNEIELPIKIGSCICDKDDANMIKCSECGCVLIFNKSTVNLPNQMKKELRELIEKLKNDEERFKNLMNSKSCKNKSKLVNEAEICKEQNEQTLDTKIGSELNMLMEEIKVDINNAHNTIESVKKSLLNK